VIIDVVITQDDGAVNGQTRVNVNCGRQAVSVVTDPSSPPFHLGDAQMTINWTVTWLEEIPAPPFTCGNHGCFAVIDESGLVSAPTLITSRGTQPPAIPPPF
jgi:hypothetical protein